MGTPEFAVSSLLTLYKNPKFEIILVITEPDKPAQRNLEIQKPAIKKLAQKLNLKIFQPKSLKKKGVIKKILMKKPDLIITVAYGKLLPKELLKNTINFHPSLLPKYRGPSPIQAVILAGDKKTGITIMKMDEKMDHGPILAQKEIKIQKNETYKSLSEKLAKTGADFLIDTLKKYLAGKIKPKKQNHQKATICKLIKKENGKLDFQKPAEILEKEIRAYFPWPGSYMQIQVKNKSLNVKILEVQTHKIINQEIPKGQFYSPNKKDLYINCSQDALKILKLQIEGKNPISSQDFINGYLKF